MSAKIRASGGPLYVTQPTSALKYANTFTLCITVCLFHWRNWKVQSFFFVIFFEYLLPITSQVHDLFREQGSIQRAMMLQTSHCLLYLSVSFTHLKRSTDFVVLRGREPCPLLSGLIGRLLQNILYQRFLSIFVRLVCTPLSACEREFLPRVSAQTFSILHVLPRSSKRWVKTVFYHQAGSAPLWRPWDRLLPHGPSPALWVCVQNITEAVVVGEVAAAVAIDVWEEWRLRISVFKHRCPIQAFIWQHLGTACSTRWLFPGIQEEYWWNNSTATKESEKWELNCKARLPEESTTFHSTKSPVMN